MFVKEKNKQKLVQVKSNYPITLDFSDLIDFDEDKLFRFCLQNKELRIERTKEGKLIIMLPVGSEGGAREITLGSELYIWNKKNKLGKVFNSSAGFTLPDGSVCSADVAYIVLERWKAIPFLKRKKFAPICPDFVIELKSESDDLDRLQNKMLVWRANGCRLGWLIDPCEENAYIYRANGDIESVASFAAKLSAEDLLPGFELELALLLEDQ